MNDESKKDIDEKVIYFEHNRSLLYVGTYTKSYITSVAQLRMMNTIRVVSYS